MHYLLEAPMVTERTRVYEGMISFKQERIHVIILRRTLLSQIFINVIGLLITIKCPYCINSVECPINFFSYAAFVCYVITIAIKIKVEIWKKLMIGKFTINSQYEHNQL